MDIIIKAVLNVRHGGYSLSKEAYKFLGIEWDGYGYAFDNDRTNPELIKCVETLGEKANGELSELRIIEKSIEIKNHAGIESF